ncbi:MAG: 3-oxoacyl-[acyl-carrier-protein] reductase [Lachnospiraceae bacterium]|nr:3-oxoacyl-[acyl-carrier-protein] reductase [Lachnospiraceae bacterium]
MTFDLSGQVALVTGASGGIGREVSLALAEGGAKVALVYYGNELRAKEVADQIKNQGGTAKIFQCDVADFQAVGQLVKDIGKTLGKIEILVNCAGITRDGLLAAMKEEDFDTVLAANLKGTFNTMRHVSRQMMRLRHGRIINIASVTGVAGNAGQANYCASKAGVIGLTKSAAKELGVRNITVNAVAPGFIRTEMTEGLSEEVKEAAKSAIPLGRFGEPTDVAKVVEFLASHAASYITGQVLCVDGGMVM